MNISDFYIGNTRPDTTYIDNMELDRFSKILWYDTSYNNYNLLMTDVSAVNNIPNPATPDISYVTYPNFSFDICKNIFNNTNNITLFVSNPKSRYRGVTFYKGLDTSCNLVQVVSTDMPSSIYYPPDARLIALANPLRDKPTSQLTEYNCASTQPFLSGNEWYTKIFYKGSTEFLGKYTDFQNNINTVFNDIDYNKYVGGIPKYNKYESAELFISGMKGLQIPYTDISIPEISANNSNYYTNTNIIMKPSIPDYYITTNPIIEDYSPYLITDQNNRTIYGQFVNIDKNYYNRSTLSFNKYYDTGLSFKDTNSSYEYPYVIVKGLYFGYGGHMQERPNKEIINTIVNNNIGLTVNKINVVDTTQYIYTELPVVYSQYFLQNNFNQFNKSNSKARNRLNNIPYDIESDYIDKIFENRDNILDLVSIYGRNGRIVKKNITTPYNLNPNNYIFLVIPNLNHIGTIQNYDIKDGAFAKILLPGDTNRVLYNTHVAATKVYYDYLFNNLSQLEIAFVTNGGNLFDFSGSEHSISLEITEIVDKLEYINPRYGNIEF
jgi:hypothetical protein